jgi:pimeloyl-ACP methyl ester carboxylesterase
VDELGEDGGALVLMGSSFGALVCAIAAGRRPERVAALVLMAPAFDMPGLWQRQLGTEGIEVWKKEGYVPIEHPAYELPQPLKYGFYEDALEVDTAPRRVSQPCLVFHGKNDDVVDPELARRFGELNPQAAVHMLDDGHDLLETQEVMAGEVEAFLKKSLKPWAREGTKGPEADG